MRGRSGWSALLALSLSFSLSFTISACDEGSPPSGPESVSPAPSPGEPPSSRSAVDSPDHVARDLYFVELEEAPTSRGGHLDRLLVERARFRRSARLSGVALQERYAYTRLWNGLSARVTADQLASLRMVDGVKAVFPVHTVKLDDTPGGNVTPDLFTALAMTGADIAQSTLGLTGQKILVGVIDSGVDYNHPDLGGCFGAGCRVVMGHDFVGDSYDAGDATTQPEPDDDPDDCAGHGTHVAGIIGANGLVKGVAPAASLAAYRVFGCKGSAGTDVIVKAMEAAAADGVRVVNMSLGSSFVWPESPEAKAANQLVRSGVVVVASIGNSGAAGLWAAGAPGNADLVIGTASVENTAVAGPAFQISPHGTMAGGGLVGFNAAAGSPVIPSTGTLPLTRTGTVTATDDACAALPAGSLTGQIALVRRGGCSFFLKASNAEAAGAAGVILYNNVPEGLNPSVAGSPAVTVPVVGISGADGEAINAQLDAGSATLSWGTSVVTVANPLANTVSSFSSLGLTAELGLKPDIAAPGGSIYSTWPLELGGYASESGTSMASPHVAGAAALLLQARPGLSATRVREILQNNAVPALDASSAVADSVHRQGAGLLHIDAAVLNPVRATPSKIALGESEGGPVTTKVTLTNEGSTAVTCAVTHVPALSTTGSTYAPTSLAGGYATAVFDAPTITVPAGGSASVSATITADPALAEGGLYGGYLVFTPEGAGATGTLRVPYSGFKGDYQALAILAPTTNGYPWLTDKTGAKKPSGATFTLRGGDTPRVVVHFEHAARLVKMNIVEATKLKSWGRALTEDYYPQSSATVVGSDATDATFTFTWNGTTTLGKKVVEVPNGDYLIKLSVLKALGDPSRAADWEVWTSPVVTINHP
jgi:minor extracellular serine protease Vpr